MTVMYVIMALPSQPEEAMEGDCDMDVGFPLGLQHPRI